MAQSDSSVNHFEMLSPQPLIKRVITTEIKTNINASETFDQDPTGGV